MSKIEPKILKGFRDFLPEKQIGRQRMIDKIKGSFEMFGFEPLETPALEYAETLTGKYGDEGDKLMYRFKDNGGREVALRYDLTIPLARVIAQYGEIKKPFKRYQISPVWRADNPQKGRYREFYQCDADIAGTASSLADAEVLALSSKTLNVLGVKEFVIRVNSRKILSAFYDSFGMSDAQKKAALRAVDKMEKIGREAVISELDAAGLKETSEKIAAFAETTIDFTGAREELDQVAEAFPSIKPQLAELIGIVDSALILSPDTRFVLDLSIARGLDYYTGLIFETNLVKAPQFGSVLSGGRYDELVGMFSNRPVPVVGLSVGLDRLYSALEELGLLQSEKGTATAIIVNLESKYTEKYLSLATELRDAGISATLYYDDSDLKKQLSYADEKGIRFALIYGSDEAKDSKIIVKDLDKGKQESIDFDSVVEYVKKR